MRGLSLQDAMMQVAAGLEDQSLSVASSKPAVSQSQSAGMSELQAFIALDPLLAGLHKEFIDTKERAAEVTAKNGFNDPMAQIAADLEDSAWCRMQTRYLELRARRDLMKKAQEMMRAAERAEERQEKAEKDRKVAALMHHIMVVEDQKKRKAMPSLIEWLIFVMFVDWDYKRMQKMALPLHQRFAA